MHILYVPQIKMHILDASQIFMHILKVPCMYEGEILIRTRVLNGKPMSMGMGAKQIQIEADGRKASGQTNGRRAD